MAPLLAPVPRFGLAVVLATTAQLPMHGLCVSLPNGCPVAHDEVVPYSCVRSGPRPDPNCVSWRDGLCEYNQTAYPDWAGDAIATHLSLLGGNVCTDQLVTSCINITSSARIVAALKCVKEGVSNQTLVEYEFMSLPVGQLRLTDGGSELIITSANDTTDDSSSLIRAPGRTPGMYLILGTTSRRVWHRSTLGAGRIRQPP
jgi:hypothetical protein